MREVEVSGVAERLSCGSRRLEWLAAREDVQKISSKVVDSKFKTLTQSWSSLMTTSQRRNEKREVLEFANVL